MLRLCFQRTLSLGVRGAPRRWLGTHKHMEKLEPLSTSKGAKDFIYSLHAKERSCLLRELQNFESIAIAQGKGTRHRLMSRLAGTVLNGWGNRTHEIIVMYRTYS